MPNCDKQLSLRINGASAEQILGLTSEQARCLKLLNQSTWARQWSKAWINSCVTTLFIWDCWWILFWHKTICKHTTPHSFLMLKKNFQSHQNLLHLYYYSNELALTWEEAASKPPLTVPSHSSQEKCLSLSTLLCWEKKDWLSCKTKQLKLKSLLTVQGKCQHRKECS